MSSFRRWPIWFCIVFILQSSLPTAFAATYYVDPSVPDDAGNGSPTSPKKYITSGIQLMSSGDTLILKAGIYGGARNMIGDDASPKVYPPSGAARTPTTIRSEHIGSAVIDGGYKLVPFSSVNKSGTTTDYLKIDGIHFRRGNRGAFNIKGSHNKITNCGFEDGMSPSSQEEVPIAYVAGGSSYSLVEDCWIWGKGRYGMYTSSPEGGTSHIIFRRVVVRLDDTPPKWMSAGLRFYNGSSNAMQNCIVIDSHVDSTAGNPEGIASGGGSSGGERNHYYTGNIILNNPQMWGFSPERGSLATTFTNNVLWGNLAGVYQTKDYVLPYTLTLSNLTIGNSKTTGVRYNSNYSGTVNILHTLVQVPDGGSAFQAPSSISNTFVYTPGSGTVGENPGGYRVIDRAMFLSGLKYLPRIEHGTAIAVAGVGANILYQTGVSGTLRGDDGWNTTTMTPLWPFPNERLWAAKMKTYTATGPGGGRGFAAVDSDTPLTDYIWGYLGNTVPPMHLKAVPGKNQVVLNWTASRTKPDITGYKVYVGTASGKYNVPPYAGGKDVGKPTSTTIKGLASGTTYYFAVTAVDPGKGETGFSYEVSAKTH